MRGEIRRAASSQNPRATTTSADSLQIYATARRSPRTTASADPSQNSTAQRHSPYTKPMAACTYASDGGLSIAKST